MGLASGLRGSSLQWMCSAAAGAHTATTPEGLQRPPGPHTHRHHAHTCTQTRPTCCEGRHDAQADHHPVGHIHPELALAVVLPLVHIPAGAQRGHSSGTGGGGGIIDNQQAAAAALGAASTAGAQALAAGAVRCCSQHLVAPDGPRHEEVDEAKGQDERAHDCGGRRLQGEAQHSSSSFKGGHHADETGGQAGR